jgi:hypothetical protein
MPRIGSLAIMPYIGAEPLCLSDGLARTSAHAARRSAR